MQVMELRLLQRRRRLGQRLTDLRVKRCDLRFSLTDLLVERCEYLILLLNKQARPEAEQFLGDGIRPSHRGTGRLRGEGDEKHLLAVDGDRVRLDEAAGALSETEPLHREIRQRVALSYGLIVGRRPLAVFIRTVSEQKRRRGLIRS